LKSKHWLNLILLAAPVILIFAGILFGPEGVVLSELNSDLLLQGVHWREFGFGELRNGNLPLWNPHVFSGMPFLGSFESAMLYPPNFIYMVMPLAKAITVSTMLHLLLAGMFMYFWALRQRLHPAACWLSSFLVVFSAPLFMHVYAGHISVVSSAAWIPLVFLSVDLLVDRPSIRRVLLATFAISMQILAGHPQTVYFTAIVAFIMGFVLILSRGGKCTAGSERSNPRKGLRSRFNLMFSDLTSNFSQMLPTMAFLAVVYVGAALLTAVQLFTGMDAAKESVRANGLPYEYASAFAFPPENLITLLVPSFFGDLRTFPYWGRYFIWEMSLFMGVSSFFMAVLGVLHGQRDTKRFVAVMAVGCIILALGSHTPLYRIFYNVLPGFNKFRGSSKFILQASPFLALLAGHGMDSLVRGIKPSRRFVATIFGLAILLGIAAICVRHSASDPFGYWQSILMRINQTRETAIAEDACVEPTFILKSGLFTSNALLWCAGLSFLVGLLMLKPVKLATYALFCMAILDCFLYCHHYAVVTDLHSGDSPMMDRIIENNPGDYRILRLGGFDVPVSVRRQDMWGYDPLIPKRYAEFMAYTQGTEISLDRYHPFHALLRCRFVFLLEGEKVNVMRTAFTMPRLCLVPRWIVKNGRDEIFKTMSAPSFHPMKVVILESAPKFKTNGGSIGGAANSDKVVLRGSTTDQLVIFAEVSKPQILLITDPYSTGWRARGLPGSSQKQYEVMPADYVLRAIPLGVGKHRILLEYMPTGFRVGMWVSIVSVIIYSALLVVSLRGNRKQASEQSITG